MEKRRGREDRKTKLNSQYRGEGMRIEKVVKTEREKA